MLMKRPFMGYYVEKDWKNYNLTKSKIDKLSIDIYEYLLESSD